MTQRVLLEPAFVLHTRPYSNTSLLVEFITPQYGRVPALARSARGMKSRYKGILQLFTPLLISWSGKRELKTLIDAEFTVGANSLEGQALMCGFYLNELLMHLIQRDDPYPVVYELYQQTLQQLAEQSHLQGPLRRFEKRLLERLGYGLPLQHEAHTKEVIRADCYYHYVRDRGFLRCAEDSEDSSKFSGKHLLAIREEQWDDEEVMQDAKRLMRMTLSELLGNKVLQSRQLFM